MHVGAPAGFAGPFCHPHSCRVDSLQHSRINPRVCGCVQMGILVMGYKWLFFSGKFAVSNFHAKGTLYKL